MDVYVRVCSARPLEQVARLERVRNGADQALGLGEIGCLEQAALPGVSADDLDALGAQLLGRGVELVDHEEGHATRLQRLADTASDLAVADENGMAAQAGDREFGRGHRDSRAVRSARCLASLEARTKPVEGEEQERIDQDGQDRARQDQVTPVLRQEPNPNAQSREDERKLADLGKAHRDGERRAHRMSEGQHDEERRNRLADDRA